MVKNKIFNPTSYLFAWIFFLTFAANAEQKTPTLAELNQKHHGAIQQYIYASKTKLRDNIIEDYSDGHHLAGLEPIPSDVRRAFFGENGNDEIWWPHHSIIDHASINYSSKRDEITVFLAIIFYGSTNRELNVAIANTISIGRSALGLQRGTGTNTGQPYGGENLEFAYRLYKKIFPMSDWTSCEGGVQFCLNRASPEQKHIATNILSKIKVEVSVRLPMGSAASSSWLGSENFYNLDSDCPDFGTLKGGWKYLSTFKHSADLGHSTFPEQEKRKGSAPAYHVTELSKFDRPTLNAYLKGAALCAQKGYDLRKLTIERILRLGPDGAIAELY